MQDFIWPLQVSSALQICRWGNLCPNMSGNLFKIIWWLQSLVDTHYSQTSNLYCLPGKKIGETWPIWHIISCLIYSANVYLDPFMWMEGTNIRKAKKTQYLPRARKQAIGNNKDSFSDTINVTIKYLLFCFLILTFLPGNHNYLIMPIVLNWMG